MSEIKEKKLDDVRIKVVGNGYLVEDPYGTSASKWVATDVAGLVKILGKILKPTK